MASVSAADADTFGDKLSVMQARSRSVHKPKPQTPLPPSMSPLWMVQILLVCSHHCRHHHRCRCSQCECSRCRHLWRSSSVMQARSRSVVTQTKTSQTSPLPPSMSPLWMVQPLLVLLTTADTITVVDAASVSAADADTLATSPVMQARLRSWRTNQNLADIATATVNVTTVDGATLLVLLHHCDTTTVVDAASVVQPMQTPLAASSSVMQARCGRGYTNQNPQTSPLPPSRPPGW